MIGLSLSPLNYLCMLAFCRQCLSFFSFPLPPPGKKDRLRIFFPPPPYGRRRLHWLMPPSFPPPPLSRIASAGNGAYFFFFFFFPFPHSGFKPVWGSNPSSSPSTKKRKGRWSEARAFTSSPSFYRHTFPQCFFPFSFPHCERWKEPTSPPSFAHRFQIPPLFLLSFLLREIRPEEWICPPFPFIWAPAQYPSLFSLPFFLSPV